ncbi:DUF4105 domain-containing protein [Microbulbifer sp. S227A]|uniref:Lnb N-terminal periplasmic domain-containing protein n=1 Tax=Microbulbifer sp. S227A TaxID=3415131 RepID=UPI003C7A95F3
MFRIIRLIPVLLCLLAVALATVWGCLALWYHAPLTGQGKLFAIAGFAVFGLIAGTLLFTRRRIGALGLFGLVLAGLLFWWNGITPPAERNWAPDVARQVTGQIDGDILTLDNLRNFDWHGPDKATAQWETRSYDLAQLQTVDMFLSYWAGPLMAHFIVSFGFSDGEHLAWSVEVRRESDGAFSPIADAFKSNTLVIVAADERDVVGVRSNLRNEDVQLFRLAADPQVARALLTEYVRDANALAQQPAFYNSLTTNCTTVVVRMMQAIGNGLPLDWRLLVNGYLPDYAYDHQALDMRHTLPDLRALGRIDPRARAHGLKPGFSGAIRRDVPRPD